VGRNGHPLADAAREVAVARWLASVDVSTIPALSVSQPVVADGRAVTFWESVADRPGRVVNAPPDGRDGLPRPWAEPQPADDAVRRSGVLSLLRARLGMGTRAEEPSRHLID